MKRVYELYGGEEIEFYNLKGIIKYYKLCFIELMLKCNVLSNDMIFRPIFHLFFFHSTRFRQK
jgi:hypothetical protein